MLRVLFLRVRPYVAIDDEHVLTGAMDNVSVSADMSMIQSAVEDKVTEKVQGGVENKVWKNLDIEHCQTFFKLHPAL